MNPPSEQQLYDAAELSEATAEELIRRGEALIGLGRQLLIQAGALSAQAAGLDAEVPAVNDRSVGRKGAVTIGTAIETVKRIGVFKRSELQEELGLSASATMKWIRILSENKPRPIITLVMESSQGRPATYEYNKDAVAPDPTTAPRHAPDVDRMAGVGADLERDGMPVQYTGRPMGSTGKPGLDKKLSKKRPVRRKSGQMMGKR